MILRQAQDDKSCWGPDSAEHSEALKKMHLCCRSARCSATACGSKDGFVLALPGVPRAWRSHNRDRRSRSTLGYSCGVPRTTRHSSAGLTVFEPQAKALMSLGALTWFERRVVVVRQWTSNFSVGSEQVPDRFRNIRQQAVRDS